MKCLSVFKNNLDKSNERIVPVVLVSAWQSLLCVFIIFFCFLAAASKRLIGPIITFPAMQNGRAMLKYRWVCRLCRLQLAINLARAGRQGLKTKLNLQEFIMKLAVRE